MSEFLTVREVCRLLRIGERTAYELCRTGQLAGAVKVGGQWRVERAAFEEWIRKGGDASRDSREPKEERA